MATFRNKTSLQSSADDFLIIVSVLFEEGNLAVKRGYGELNRAEIDYTKRPLFDHIRAYGQIYLPFLMATDNFRRLQAKGLQALASRHDIQDDAVVQPNVE